jgi:hypothetical protein
MSNISAVGELHLALISPHNGLILCLNCLQDFCILHFSVKHIKQLFAQYTLFVMHIKQFFCPIHSLLCTLSSCLLNTLSLLCTLSSCLLNTLFVMHIKQLFAQDTLFPYLPNISIHQALVLRPSCDPEKVGVNQK